MHSLITQIFKSAYLTSLLLAGCGGGPKTDSSQSAPAAEAGGPAAGNSGRFSIVVDRAAGLPKCDSASDRQLVFARDVGQFFSCEGGAWADVPVGKNGERGESGAAGAAGPEGVAGPAGPAGETFAKNHWLDPINGKLWIIAGVSSRVNTEQTCTGEWHLPSIEEARSAALHGIFVAFLDYGRGWVQPRLVTSEFQPGGSYANSIYWTPSDSVAGPVPGTYRVAILAGGSGRGDSVLWDGRNSGEDQFIACVHSTSGP